MADAKPQDQQQDAPRTEQSFLQPDERSQMQRFLGFPEEFPRKFGSWIADYIAVNGLEIPASQIRGNNQFRPTTGVAGTVEDLDGNNAYQGNSASVPTIQLGKGQFLLLYGFQSAYNFGNNGGYGFAAPVLNNATPADSDAVRTRFLLGEDTQQFVTDEGGTYPVNVTDDQRSEGSCVYFKILDVVESDSQVNFRYKGSDGNIKLTNMWVIAIKISN